MTETQVKKALERYRKTMAEAEDLQSTLEEVIRTAAMPAQQNDGMPRAVFSRRDLSETTVRLEEIRKKIGRKMREALDECRAALELIGMSDDVTARTMMRHHYVSGMTWEKTAEKAGYSEAQLYRIVGAAIKEIAKKTKS